MQLARMALCQLAFHCIFSKLGWGGVGGKKSEGGRGFNWYVTTQSTKKSEKLKLFKLCSVCCLAIPSDWQRTLSERFEATAFLINSIFARETARKNLPVNIITWIQSHRCSALIFFFNSLHRQFWVFISAKIERLELKFYIHMLSIFISYIYSWHNLA